MNQESIKGHSECKSQLILSVNLVFVNHRAASQYNKMVLGKRNKLKQQVRHLLKLYKRPCIGLQVNMQ